MKESPKHTVMEDFRCIDTHEVEQDGTTKAKYCSCKCCCCVDKYSISIGNETVGGCISSIEAVSPAEEISD